MRILFCSTEIYPYIKTGGLGDITGALPPALKKSGNDVRLFLPGYPAILQQLQDVQTLSVFPVYFGAQNVRILKGFMPGGLCTYVLDAPDFWNRAGIYVDEKGNDWPDNHYRFAAFCRAATDLPDYDYLWRADIVHGNDWQCGLIAPYLKLKNPYAQKNLMTIHNIAYQGLFRAEILPGIGLPGSMFTERGAEFYNKVGYLKAGLAYADHITTVSPTYAREIQSTDQGCGLEGFLWTKSAQISGILNGIDEVTWNPETDANISFTYSVKNFTARNKNREILATQHGLILSPDKPLFAVISRLGYHKGFDFLLEAMPDFLELGGTLLLLGAGDVTLEQEFLKLAGSYPDQVSVVIGYDESLAHRIQAGADVLVMPSRSEPCGLVQLYAMRYGAVPFVRLTGGLADTVIDITAGSQATGFGFTGNSSADLAKKLPVIFEIYKNKSRWQQLQKTGMNRHSGWNEPARLYTELYEKTINQL